MERGFEQKMAEESEKRGLKVESVSITSSKHQGRNEDAALGDLGRLEAEITNPPELETDPNFAKIDQETFQKWADKEKAAVSLLKELGIHGVLDGVSSSTTGTGKEKKPNGSGVIASRISSGVTANRLSQLRPGASVEASAKAIRNAMLEANKTVLTYSSDREDLKNMASTADILRLIESEDDSYDMAYGHVGDSRIYILDGETNELRQVTTDDNPATEALQEGLITKEHYDLIMNAKSKDDIPEIAPDPKLKYATTPFIKKLFNLRNRGMTNAIGSDKETFRVSSGIEKLKKGDVILITTDGIHDNLTEMQIQGMLVNGLSAEEIAQRAREIANSGEGKMDDITVKKIVAA